MNDFQPHEVMMKGKAEKMKRKTKSTSPLIEHIGKYFSAKYKDHLQLFDTDKLRSLKKIISDTTSKLNHVEEKDIPEIIAVVDIVLTECHSENTTDREMILKKMKEKLDAQYANQLETLSSDTSKRLQGVSVSEDSIQQKKEKIVNANPVPKAIIAIVKVKQESCGGVKCDDVTMTNLLRSLTNSLKQYNKKILEEFIHHNPALNKDDIAQQILNKLYANIFIAYLEVVEKYGFLANKDTHRTFIKENICTYEDFKLKGKIQDCINEYMDTVETKIESEQDSGVGFKVVSLQPSSATAREPSAFKTEFLKRFSKMAKAKVYNGKDEINAIYFGDGLCEIFPETFENKEKKSNLAGELRSSISVQRDVGFCRKEVDYLTITLKNYCLFLINEHVSDEQGILHYFFERMYNGTYNLELFISVIEEESERAKLLKDLAHLKVYPLLRATNNADTNYISQPLSNLIETVFSCHILGFEHKSKISSCKESLENIRSYFDKRGRNTRTKAISLIINLHHKLLEFLSHDSEEIKSVAFNEHYDINSTFQEEVDRHLRKPKVKAFLVAMISQIKQIVDVAIVNEDRPQEILTEAEKFFCETTSKSHNSASFFAAKAKEYLEADNPFIDYIQNSGQPQSQAYQKVASSSSSSSSSCIASSSSASSSEHDFTPTSLDEVIKEVAERAKVVRKLPAFPAIIPNFKSPEPVVEEQILIFLELHHKQLLQTLSLKDLAKEIGNEVCGIRAVPLDEKSLRKHTRIQAIEVITTKKGAGQIADEIQSAEALGYAERTIGYGNETIPLSNLPMVFTKIQEKNITLPPGAGFLVVFVNANGEKLGVIAKRRGMKIEDCKLQVTWGGKADPNKSLEGALMDTQEVVIKGVPQFNVPSYDNDNEKKQINMLTMDIKKALINETHAATVNIGYDSEDHSKNFCYLTVEVQIQVENEEEIRKKYPFLFEDKSQFEPTNPRWYFVQYQSFENMMKDESQQETHSQWMQDTSSNNPPLLVFKGVYPLVKGHLHKTDSAKDEPDEMEISKSPKAAETSASSSVNAGSSSGPSFSQPDKGSDKKRRKLVTEHSMFSSATSKMEIDDDQFQRSSQNQ